MTMRLLIGLLGNLLEWAPKGYEAWKVKQLETLRAIIDVAF